MKLSQEDADLFFRLFIGVLIFVNQRLLIIPKVTNSREYFACTLKEKMQIREAMYEKSYLIDEFIKENPRGFSQEELAIVGSWKKFVSGEFAIERFLKKYAIFIHSHEVYGVLGLKDAIEDILPHVRLPIYTQTVLLPFKGRIVCDGILSTSSISFGREATSLLKEAYLTAKQNRKIIESLDDESQLKSMKKTKHHRIDWGDLINGLVSDAEKLQAGPGDPVLLRPTFNLLRASMELTRFVVENPYNPDEIWRKFEKIKTATSKLETMLYRAH